MPTFEKGFSLIEVMITVAIVGILAAVAYPAYTDQIAKGKRNECRSGALQAMQQQERYYSQFNTYLEVAVDATNPKIRTFSGDRAGSSACTIASALCPTPTGGTAPSAKACIEVQANLTNDPKGISMIYLDSLGNKGCVINGARNTTETACWK